MFARGLFYSISLLAAASPLTQACITGNNDAGLGNRQNLQISDNGVTVCDSYGTGGGGTINCNAGYSPSYHDTTVNGDFPVHYCRGSQKALKAHDAELLRRIARLEGMFSHKLDARSAGVDGGRAGGVHALTSNSAPMSGSSVPGEGGISLGDHYATFVKQQVGTSRHLNYDFWASLNDEFDSLRQFVKRRVDDEDDFEDYALPLTEITGPSESFILQDPGDLSNIEVVYPSEAQSLILVQFYFANIDPVCKIAHRQTITAYF